MKIKLNKEEMSNMATTMKVSDRVSLTLPFANEGDTRWEISTPEGSVRLTNEEIQNLVDNLKGFTTQK